MHYTLLRECDKDLQVPDKIIRFTKKMKRKERKKKNISCIIPSFPGGTRLDPLFPVGGANIECSTKEKPKQKDKENG